MNVDNEQRLLWEHAPDMIIMNCLFYGRVVSPAVTVLYDRNLRM